MMSSSVARNALLVAVLCALVGCSSAFQVPSSAAVIAAPRSSKATIIKSANSEYEYPDYDFDDSYRDSYLEDTTAENINDNFYYVTEQDDDEDRWKIQLMNNILQILHNSFKNVEGTANKLLEDEPAVALSIFVGAGVLTAYVLGLVILDGYMESWNPVQNGMAPYWDEEILVMMKRVH